MRKRAYADIEGPDQPAHARSLTRAFTIRLYFTALLCNHGVSLFRIHGSKPRPTPAFRWLVDNGKHVPGIYPKCLDTLTPDYNNSKIWISRFTTCGCI